MKRIGKALAGVLAVFCGYTEDWGIGDAAYTILSR